MKHYNFTLFLENQNKQINENTTAPVIYINIYTNHTPQLEPIFFFVFSRSCPDIGYEFTGSFFALIIMLLID